MHKRVVIGMIIRSLFWLMREVPAGQKLLLAPSRIMAGLS
jgi:hypothetical protein